MPNRQALQIVRIGLNVLDLDSACAFYADALGFSVETRERNSQVAVLGLGGQQIELIQAGPAARPYPEARAANDPWFQHFAIAVSDMDQAYARLATHAQQPISQSGPQLLPPSTGSVTAYKFRDPDGHPLELSLIPNSTWTVPPRTGGPFLGIDHSAVAVSDLDRSVAFYTQVLGLTVTGKFLNEGAEQDRLDGLADAQVDIIALATARPGPHIELLHYRSPRSAAAPYEPKASDIAASRLILQIGDIDALIGALKAMGLASMVIHTERGRRVLTSDPDGHGLELLEL